MSSATLNTARAQAKPAETLEIATIAKFFVPLAAVSMCYAIVFNIMNTTMARMENAAIILATFSVGQSIADLMSTPASQGRQWLLARGRDKKSFRAGLKVMLQVAALSLVLMAAVAFTPFGDFIFGTIFRAPQSLRAGLSTFVKFCMPLPIAFVLRSAGHAILMLSRKTHLMTIGVFVRLSWAALVATVVLRTPSLQGPATGAFMWISSMCLESIVDVALAWRSFRNYPDEPANGALPQTARIWSFMMPLMATGVLWALGKPMINMGMARTSNPERAIAVYQVAWNAAWLILAYVQDSLRQVVVVFWTDGKALETLNRFGRIVAITITVILLGATISGGALWFIRNVVGAPEELVSASRSVFLVLSLLPMPFVATELFVGRLLRNGKTTAIAIARSANLGVMLVTVFLMATLVPEAGALLGALALLFGSIAECGVVGLAVRYMSPLPNNDD
ncbi:MAG: hypothetical protein Q8P50_01310 [Bacillota bacterium]|nr:hypothetical protein [Bacillota bacterium]